MSNIFLVTSGIHGPGGVNGKVPILTRIIQTLETAQSIRHHVPDAKIYLLEGGSEPLNINLREQFLNGGYDDIFDFTQSAFIAFAHAQRDAAKQEITVIKGPCESYMLKEATKLLVLTNDDRVFKISGRYRLSDEFSLETHRAAVGKYLFKTKTECLQWYKEPPVHSPYQYSTRLYSWCGSLQQAAIYNYDKVQNWILELYSKNLYMDIEHSMYLHIDQSLIAETDPIGLIGAFSEVPDMVIKE